mmetsp:Transcript_37597/g.83721  ORF Transcript_37597/g.83721 Transcript_37597/m.83721 type:complete len:205 (+) Transcript_37597:47-661(+)|eukprot:CAMPEP_0202901974 /NCGR_PEP_ID=MMETSP1392-20130828/15639_1 /ASSEMBLY_ACC=CAM_ASM_000868 /TAXON_ID=225041 /ORGANISM="Chlamydomonas chlamydogama, Strain SAG 11-48b" /LENGTH=204 /DNA_ID=CAMNT_0049588645 /DNA_START=30 /DNA_END=644 /DNA_ORIENTATION=+
MKAIYVMFALAVTATVVSGARIIAEDDETSVSSRTLTASSPSWSGVYVGSCRQKAVTNADGSSASCLPSNIRQVEFSAVFWLTGGKADAGPFTSYQWQTGEFNATIKGANLYAAPGGAASTSVSQLSRNGKGLCVTAKYSSYNSTWMASLKVDAKTGIKTYTEIGYTHLDTNFGASFCPSSINDPLYCNDTAKLYNYMCVATEV